MTKNMSASGQTRDWTQDEIDAHAAQQLADRQRLKGDAKAEVDRQAEAARLAFVTPGGAQQAVYLRKAEEAERVVGGETGDPATHKLLAASVGIEVPDTGDAAADILSVAQVVVAQRDAWTTIAAAIEATRLAAKAAVDALADPPDPADVRAILTNLSWPSPG